MARLFQLTGTKSIEFPQYPAAAWDFSSEPPEDPVSFYNSVAAIYRAINLNAEAVANLPFALVKNKQDYDVSDDWQNAVGFMPNPRELLRLWRMSLAMTNSAYGFMEGNRAIQNLRYIVPTTITPVANAKDGLTGFKRRIGSQTIEYKLKEQRIFWMWRLDHATELLPTDSTEYRAMASAGGVLYYADWFVQNFFKRGGIKPTMLMVKGVPSKEEREKIESIWDKVIHGFYKYLGKVFNADAIEAVPIGEGIENLKDVEFIESKLADIALAAGIPLSLLLANSANYATAQTEYLTWFRDSVIPWARFIEGCLNDQLFTPLGLHFEFRPEMSDPGQEDEVSRAGAYQAYVNAGMKPSIAAQVVGIELPPDVEYDDLDEKPEPEPEPEPQSSTDQPTTDTNTETPAVETPAVRFIPSLDQYSEMDLWRTMAFRKLKRKEPLPLDFEVKALPDEVAAIVRQRLGQAETQDDIKAAYEDIVMPNDLELRNLADAINRAVAGGGTKAIQVQLPPVNISMPQVVSHHPAIMPYLTADTLAALGYEAGAIKQDIPTRDKLEKQLRTAIEKQFGRRYDLLIDSLGIPPNIANLPPEFWDEFSADLGMVMTPLLYEIALSQVEIVLAALPVGTDIAIVNQAAANWARQYTDALVRDLSRTTRESVQRSWDAFFRDSGSVGQSISEFFEQSGMTIGDLFKVFEPAFGKVRAEMISITEVTRASVQGELALVNQLQRDNPSLVFTAIWQTNNDDVVCPICAPNNGKPAGEWTTGSEPPPAHPRCRCWINHEMRVSDVR